MPTLVEIPRLYENMSTVTIGSWRYGVGQHVNAGDILVELIGEKSVEDFAAPVSGTLLAIYGESQSVVPARYVICALGDAGEPVPDVSESNAKLVAASDSQVTMATGFAPVTPAPVKKTYQVAPAAKLLAKQLGINLDEVAHACQRSIIHRNDVMEYAQKCKTASSAELPVTPQPHQPAPSAQPHARVALLTGATGNIGCAIARRLAQMGIQLALQYNSNVSKASELTAEFPDAWMLQADLAQEDVPRKLVQSVIEHFGHLDILINCAGILHDSTIPFLSDEHWEQVIQMNLNVPFRMIRGCAMEMARQRWGRIINITSEAGRMGAANRSNYAAAKEGLAGLTRSAALEFANLGIRVNAVSPGFVESGMTATIPEARKKEILKQIPVHRFARPEDIAGIVAFLCSDEADYITGQTIAVNGGLCMA